MMFEISSSNSANDQQGKLSKTNTDHNIQFADVSVRTLQRLVAVRRLTFNIFCCLFNVSLQPISANHKVTWGTGRFAMHCDTSC